MDEWEILKPAISLRGERGRIVIQGVEICFIVSDVLKAFEVYQSIFEVECIEKTGFPKGQNEVVFSIYGVRFHMLDENPDFQMIAPKQGDPQFIWYNIAVPDISKTYQNAVDAGCKIVQPITEVETHGVKTAMFHDPFGYMWQLHQVVRDVSFEERIQAYDK